MIDTQRNRLLAQVATDPGPVQVTVAPNQRYAYVTNDGAGTVQKIDLQEYKVVKTITWVKAGAATAYRSPKAATFCLSPTPVTAPYR